MFGMDARQGVDLDEQVLPVCVATQIQAPGMPRDKGPPGRQGRVYGFGHHRIVFRPHQTVEDAETTFPATDSEEEATPEMSDDLEADESDNVDGKAASAEVAGEIEEAEAEGQPAEMDEVESAEEDQVDPESPEEASADEQVGSQIS